MRRLATALTAATVLISLAGCLPTTTKPVGHSRHLQMVLTVTIDGKPASFPIRITGIAADVTVPSHTHPGRIEHGINRDSGLPYPSHWDGYSPQTSDIDYVVERNPTTFTITGQLNASTLRTMGAAHGVRVDQAVTLRCQYFRDGKEISTSYISGIIVDSTQRAVKATRTLRVDCKWTDFSTL